jgi:hypothetical protein
VLHEERNKSGGFKTFRVEGAPATFEWYALNSTSASRQQRVDDVPKR